MCWLFWPLAVCYGLCCWSPRHREGGYDHINKPYDTVVVVTHEQVNNPLQHQYDASAQQGQQQYAQQGTYKPPPVVYAVEHTGDDVN